MLVIMFTNQYAQPQAALFQCSMSVQTRFLHLHPIVLVIHVTEALKHMKCQQADGMLLQIWQMSEHIYEDDFKADAMQP